MLWQLTRFAIVGLITTVIDLGVMKGLLSWVSVTLATSAGFGAGLVVNYMLHTRFTFKASAGWSSVVRFIAVIGFNYLLTLVCVHLGQSWFASPMLGKFVSIPLVAASGFVLCKYWVYR